MSEPITRVTLFVPGVHASAHAWSEALQRRGLRIEHGALRGAGVDAAVEVAWIENDGSFGAAFSLGTVGSDVIETIDAAPSALVLHWPVDLRGEAGDAQKLERERGYADLNPELAWEQWGLVRNHGS